MASDLPSEAWIEAFAKQCTEQLYEDAHRFAARRAGAVRKAGGIADDYYVRELVQNVISDTAAGVLRWDPTVKSLPEHVWDAIRTRTNHDRLRAKRYRHEAIDGVDPDAPSNFIGEVEAVLQDRTPSTSPELATLANEWLAALRELAAPFPALVRMVDAFEAGATTRADVMHVTGLSEKECNAARMQLRRLVRKLSLSCPVEPA